MKVESIRKGLTVKVVTVSEVVEINDRAVADFAMEAAGEKPSSLFGYRVNYFEDADGNEGACAVVDLYTD